MKKIIIAAAVALVSISANAQPKRLESRHRALRHKAIVLDYMENVISL